MKVTGRFFALYRERIGKSVMEIDIEDSSNVEDLVNLVVNTYPSLSSDASKIVVAVNRVYAEHDCVLSDGDEVAFIPPVSGGCL